MKLIIDDTTFWMDDDLADGKLFIEISSGWSYDAAYPISKDNAIEIINHLKKVFELDELAQLKT